MFVWMRRIFTALCLIAALALSTPAFCLLIANRATDFVTNFALPCFWLALALALVASVMRQWAASAGFAAAMLLTLIATAPTVWPLMPPAKHYRIVFANVWRLNAHPERLSHFVAAEHPDFVAVTEVQEPQYAAVRQVFGQAYPYVVRRDETFVASHWPIRLLPPYSHTASLVLVAAETPEGPLRLAAAHMAHPWPLPERGLEEGLEETNTGLARTAGLPTVLVGDFNTSPGGATLRRFAAEIGLKAANILVGTYPNFAPWPLRVQIDNAFAGQGLEVTNLRAGPDFGSDHRPIVVDLKRTTP